MKRLLVTGSRNWDRPVVIEVALLEAAAQYGPIQLVHGGAQGADRIAHAVAIRQQWPKPDVHRAKWKEFGFAAGPIRNREMVNAGVDLCYGFLARCIQPDCPQRGNHDSHGAHNCVTLAMNAGIETRIWTDRG